MANTNPTQTLIPLAHPVNFPAAVAEFFAASRAVLEAASIDDQDAYIRAADRCREAERFLGLFVSLDAVAQMANLAILARRVPEPATEAK